MDETRYEEYAYFNDLLPFVFRPALQRTPSTCSTSQNWHENVEIQLCTDGHGIVLLDGKSYDFSVGDIVVVNSNEIHYTYTTKYLQYTCLIIDTSFCKQMGISPGSLLFCSHFRSDIVLHLLNELTNTYADHTRPYRTAELNEIILSLLIELCKNHSVKTDRVPTKPHSFESVKATIKFIRENYNRKLSLDEIAKNAYTNKYLLSKEFKKITGRTIVGYVNHYRCQKAADHIAGGMGVTHAAWRCGFENMSFFSKTFKKYMGKLPSEYKRK